MSEYPRDAVRERPGMYVGELDRGGILNLVLELVGNAVDQHLAGRCTRVDVRAEPDGTIVVSDDGPGLPAAGRDALPPLATLLTTISYSPTVDGHRPHVHLAVGGGLGLALVATVSEWLAITTVCDGQEAHAVVSRGELVEPVTVRPTERAPGTEVRFRADPQLFREVHVARGALGQRLDELAYLLPGLRVSWSCAADPYAARGLADLVAHAAGFRAAPVAHHRGRYPTEAGPVDVEVALAWRPSWWHRPPELHSFVNLGRTPEHGTHVRGLLDGVRSARPGVARADRERNLVAAVAVVLADVHFGNPMRDRLVTPAVRPVVAAATRTALGVG